MKVWDIMQDVIQQIFDFFSGAGREVALFIVSMIPLIELRGSIILGAALNMNWLSVFLISVIGNLIPIPFIILLVRPVFAWLKKTRLLSGLVTRFEAKLLQKADKVTRYESIGLAIFVGIPLPGTGAWTGAGIAALLGMRLKPALLSITVGVIAAGVIMTAGAYGLFGFFRLF